MRRNGNTPEGEEYARWLLNVGNGIGEPGGVNKTDAEGHPLVNVPYNMRIGGQSALIDWAFPGLAMGNINGVERGAILCTRNNLADDINRQVTAGSRGKRWWSTPPTRYGETTSGKTCPWSTSTLKLQPGCRRMS